MFWCRVGLIFPGYASQSHNAYGFHRIVNIHRIPCLIIKPLPVNEKIFLLFPRAKRNSLFYLRSMQVYGLKNCDITKKTRDWLEDHQLSYDFHDYKLENISKEKLEEWTASTDWKVLLNKRSTTWRELTPEEQEKVIDKASAIKLMLEKNSIIKRPVIEYKGNLLVGYDESKLKQLLK